MKFTITDTQANPLVVSATPAADAAGNQGVFAKPLTFTADTGAFVTLSQSADGSTLTINKVGPVGLTIVSATDGVVTSTFEVEVLPSQAQGINFTAQAVIVHELTPAPEGQTVVDSNQPTV